ncbi:hypothetical protein GQ568_02565 [Patescibacteria group bacterium]|nr:hypothetical protein [Patescibacteria group bacterium]
MYVFLRSGEIITQRSGIVQVLSHFPFAVLSVFMKIENAPFLSLPFYTALTGSVFYILTKNMYGSKKRAFCLSLILIFSTMLLPYSVFGMEHIFTFTALAAFTSLFLYSKNENKYLLLIGGIFAGMATQTKAYGVLFLIPLVVYLFLIVYNRREQIVFRDYIRKGILFFIPIIFFIALGLWYNLAQFGSIFSTNYSLDQEFQSVSLWIGLYGILFSIGKGFFIYNPAAIISVFCFKDFLKNFRNEFIFIAIFLLVFVPFNAGFSFWTDEAWGQRKLLVLVPFVILPLGCYFKNINNKKLILLASAVMIGFYFNFTGTIYDYGKQITLFRKVNLDSLENIRYVPELNHISINSLFLRSYINKIYYGDSLEFSYEEESWMRNLDGKENIILSGGSVSLGDYDNPDIFLLKDLSDN